MNMNAAKRIIHQLDPEVAINVGPNAALLYSYIRYHCAAKEAEGDKKAYHEGRFWVFNSVTQFQELFPYLSEKQIRSALKSLEDANYLISGCFNRKPFDQTKWYSDLRTTVKIVEKDHLPSGADAFALQGSSHLPSGAIQNCPQGQTNTINIHSDHKKEKSNKKEKLVSILQSHLSEEIANAVVDHRKEIRKPLTERGAKLLANELAKTPDPNAAADQMIMNGWQGFRAEWLKDSMKTTSHDMIEALAKVASERMR